MPQLTRSADLLEEARQHKQELLKQISKTKVCSSAVSTLSLRDTLSIHSNIVGVGYGAKMTADKAIEGQTAVRVYVRAKLPKAQLPTDEIVPTEILGTPTDVIVVGDIVANVSCGVSVGHYRSTVAIISCIAP